MARKPDFSRPKSAIIYDFANKKSRNVYIDSQLINSLTTIFYLFNFHWPQSIPCHGPPQFSARAWCSPSARRHLATAVKCAMSARTQEFYDIKKWNYNKFNFHEISLCPERTSIAKTRAFVTIGTSLCN